MPNDFDKDEGRLAIAKLVRAEEMRIYSQLKVRVALPLNASHLNIRGILFIICENDFV